MVIKSLTTGVCSILKAIFILNMIANVQSCLCGKLLFTWLSLVMSIMVSFCAILFPTRHVLDEILNLIWGFSYVLFVKITTYQNIMIQTRVYVVKALAEVSKSVCFHFSIEPHLLKMSIHLCFVPLIPPMGH